MRYSTESKYRQYVEGSSFLSFARKFEDKYGKKTKDKKFIYTTKKRQQIIDDLRLF